MKTGLEQLSAVFSLEVDDNELIRRSSD